MTVPLKAIVHSLLLLLSHKSRPSLCGLTDCSAPGSPVRHTLPEFAQTHVHRVSDAVQPSHPLLPPSPFAINLPQHQGLFQWVVFLHQVARVLELQVQAWVLPMNMQDWFPLGLTSFISFKSKGLSRVFFRTTVWNPQFFGTQLSLWSLTSMCDYWKNHSFDYTDLCQQNDISAF